MTWTQSKEIDTSSTTYTLKYSGTDNIYTILIHLIFDNSFYGRRNQEHFNKFVAYLNNGIVIIESINEIDERNDRFTQFHCEKHKDVKLKCNKDIIIYNNSITFHKSPDFVQCMNEINYDFLHDKLLDDEFIDNTIIADVCMDWNIVKDVISYMTDSECFTLGETFKKHIILKRIKSSHCSQCQCCHDHENPYVYVHDNNIYLNCRKNKSSILIGATNPTWSLISKDDSCNIIYNKDVYVTFTFGFTFANDVINFVDSYNRRESCNINIQSDVYIYFNYNNSDDSIEIRVNMMSVKTVRNNELTICLNNMKNIMLTNSNKITE